MGPEFVQKTSEALEKIRARMLVSQCRLIIYTDLKYKSIEFQVGGYVFLRLSPMRGIKQFTVMGKLSLRFIGPFKILDRVGEVAYRLAMTPSL